VIDLRLRSWISDDELAQKLGRIVTPSDSNLVLTGPARVHRPDGSLLCIYLPGAIPAGRAAEAYPILHSLRSISTNNRGLAGGTPKVKKGTRKRIANELVRSAIIGSYDASANHRYCRLTAWTGAHCAEMQMLVPFFQSIAGHYAEQVPDRYGVQMARAARTDPAWRFAGTPFTTITVNNTYPTGVHTDAGDLESGFSCLAVLRRGEYSGGLLTFPRYRVAVDLHDRDLVLMDAHEWHGNTGLEVSGSGGERISVVCYYRTEMVRCGSVQAEHTRALADARRRTGA
jgi:2-oxoglutarate-Fe(II)-dependent dioxygenase family protein